MSKRNRTLSDEFSRRVARRAARLAAGAGIAFAASLAVPALRLPFQGWATGWQCLRISLECTLLTGEVRSLQDACIVACGIANSVMIASTACALFLKGRARILRRLAALQTASALCALLFPLYSPVELQDLGPAFPLWAGSYLLAAAATYHFADRSQDTTHLAGTPHHHG